MGKNLLAESGGMDCLGQIGAATVDATALSNRPGATFPDRQLPRVRRSVAVIGSGIAGLACAWLLARRHAVTVYEAAPRCGGHANTVDVALEGRSHPVDTGFLVFNRRTYPNLCALFGMLGVDAVDSEMSFAVSLDQPDLEWAGSSLATVFAQRGNLRRTGMWAMLRDILRFNRAATRMALGGAIPDDSLGEYLRRERFSAAFRDWYLLPMAAAIWSCPTGSMLGYPLATFVRFCHNHGLLQVFGRPRWLTVSGGARCYVDRLLQDLPDVRTGAPVTAVERGADGARVSCRGGIERYDEVVLACHSDQALALLGGGASAAERAILGAVRYQPNRAVLHTDTALLPRRRGVWSAWNYLAGEGAPDQRPVSVSYLINRLQPLPFDTPVIVSLNPFREPAADKVLQSFEYAHPVFDLGAIEAQARLGEIQGRDRCWFAGAWTGYGFHEDGLVSAQAVAAALGAPVPWADGEAAGRRVPQAAGAVVGPLTGGFAAPVVADLGGARR